ncbi:hypothetical protein OF829_05025 [Sphingomonas sp. LB-2]|uniref:hypothetical protein n=1 Tax=Sphingomonas caeni TaxID=2984949 RepID=UPI00222EE06B|nr:hypothetical protein [Sphingomonas caeni]MCW3846591.1 hypothetical protein [Sphingomonas caeni]
MRLGWDPQVKRLMLVLALTCAMGWLFKTHCAPGGWTQSEQYTTGCYSDAVPFWTGRGVAAGEMPYLQARMEYPVLTGALIWAEGGITRGLFGAQANAMHFLAVVTLVNALLAGLILWLMWRAGMDERRLWGWAAAPPLLLYVGHNWDLLAIGFAVAALLWARAQQPVRGGAAAGLGMAAKLFPVLMLPLLGLGALFGSREAWVKRMVLAAMIGAAAAAAWAAVNLPVALAAFENWSEFYRFSSERSGTAASFWEILGQSGIWPTATPDRNLYAGLLFLGGAAAIIGLGWRRHSARLWLLFTPLLGWFLLTNKVYSPQFDLWLYPFLLMTAPRLRPVALFVIGDVAAYFAEFWWFASLEQAWPYIVTPGWIALAAAIRAAAILWLIVDAVRRDPPAWLSRTANAPVGDRTGR